MNDDQPIPILAIAVTANRERHQVLVELGKQTLALAPEAAHAMAMALSHAATELCPIATERQQIAPPAVDKSAALLIDTIDVLISRYHRGGPLAPPTLLPSKPLAVALPDSPGNVRSSEGSTRDRVVGVEYAASPSAPKE